MRRAVPSFTVEVRRRPRLAANSGQDAHSAAPKTWPAAFESESHRLAAATFRAAKTPDQSSSEAAASFLKRRILESLVPEKPPGDEQRESALPAAISDRKPRARKPQTARAAKGADETSKLQHDLVAPPDLAAQVVDRSSDAPVGPSHVSPREEAAVSPAGLTANPVVAETAGPALRPKAKRKVQNSIAVDASPVPVCAKDPEAPPPVVDDVSRPSRKRTIMGRYVFGDELKPGERWKRRLFKGR